jgi:hypothetical protein
MRVSLSVEVLNKILAYLGNRPFVEVAEIVKDIHADAKEIKQSEPEINFITLPAENI